jgi:hypothetical protein
MTPDGYDDVRVLLRELDPGPLPDLDVDAIVRGGELERRRRARSRWYAVAAVLVVVAAVGAGLLTLARPEAVGPAAPGGTSSPGTFAPKPFSPQTWLLYAQPGIDAASSVRYQADLGTSPDGVTVSVDTVLGARSAQGTLDADGVTSRYITTRDGVTYVEPAVLVKTGVMKAGDAGSASWVRLSPPSESRFRAPGSVRDTIDVAYFSAMGPEYATPRVVDGRTTKAISVNATEIVPGAKVQTFFLDEQAPYHPLLVERDGRQLARFSDWNAPVTEPVAPPASDVTTVPGL